MSFWNHVKTKSETATTYAQDALGAAKDKALEHKVVLGDTYQKSVGALPTEYKASLFSGLALSALAIGGAAFVLGRVLKAEPEAASTLKKALDLIGGFVSKSAK